MFSLTFQTAPIVEPVSLDQAKNFAVISQSFTQDDSLISGLITSGRQAAEVYMSRSIFNQTWLMCLDHFPLFWGRSSIKSIADDVFPYQYFFQGEAIQLAKPRLQSITSWTYIDTSGTQQTMSSDNYVVDYNSEPARIIPAYNSYWPSASVYIPGNVQITYVSGTYGDGVEVNSCPQGVCTAIMIYVSHFYVNREGSIPLPDAFYRLLDPYKFVNFGYTSY